MTPVRLAAGILALLAVGAGLGLWGAFARLDRPHAGWEGSSVVVDIPRGTGAGAAVDRLSAAGVVRSPRLLRVWLRLTGEEGSLRAGEYLFDVPLSDLDVVDRLRRGDVLLHAVTVPEGLVLEQVARAVTDAGFSDYETFLARCRDPGPVLDIDPEAPDLEGYLFPDTYHFPRGESAEVIVAAMVARFRDVTGERFVTEAAAAGLGVREAVTLASLIEKETGVPEERWRISRVFHNRLAKGMKLQCDPTVLFAWHRRGETVDRLLYRHLELDSPYNTYVVRGLPPGPICSPGAASLDAALRPAPGNELYFVASPDGGHTFSTTLEAHNQAVRQWRSYVRSSR